MSDERIRELLEAVARREISTESALEQVQSLSVEELPYAQVDHLRPLIQGFHEVVFCEGKTASQVPAT